MLPDKFEKWDAETQADVRYCLKKHRYMSASGHGYLCYFTLGINQETGKTETLGLEITVPKDWNWEQAEPFLWKVAAQFIKYKESLDVR